MTELIGIGVAILGMLGIFKVIGWLVPDRYPDEWDDDDRNNGKHGWWG